MWYFIIKDSKPSYTSVRMSDADGGGDDGDDGGVVGCKQHVVAYSQTSLSSHIMMAEMDCISR